MKDYEEVYGIPAWHGAEAKIYIIDYNGNKAIFKHRVLKEYRHPDLDREIRVTRHRQEVKCMKKALEIGKIIVPRIYQEDLEKSIITMEYFEKAIKLKDALIKHPENELRWAKMFGSIIGRLHNLDIIHGDLTTSNILIEIEEEEKEKDSHQSNNAEGSDSNNDNDNDNANNARKAEKMILVDFGLSSISSDREDKAVDLYVLQRATEASHSDCPHFFKNFLYSYEETGNKNVILQRLRAVQSRGRKRTMIG